MRSVKPMKTAKIGYIVMSAVFCIFGILLIAHPGFSVSLIGTITGIALVVFGAVKLVGYFSKDLYRLAFQYDLAFGLLLIALGVIVLLRPDHVMNFICVVLGISILADGLFKIQMSMDAKQFGIKLWWLIMMLAILAVIVGALLVFHPTESARMLTVLLGVSLLSEGILNLITVLTAVKIIRHQQPDTIEVEYYEERKD
jgi:uncharacterized membrane protein HdeD (DUF308 family)